MDTTTLVKDSYRDGGVGRQAAEGFSVDTDVKSFERDGRRYKKIVMKRKDVVRPPTTKFRDFDNVMSLRKCGMDTSKGDDVVATEEVEMLTVNKDAQAARVGSVRRNYMEAINKRTETSKPVTSKLTNFNDVTRLRKCYSNAVTIDEPSTCDDRVGNKAVEGAISVARTEVVERLVNVGRNYKDNNKNESVEKPRPQVVKFANFDDIMRLRRRYTDAATCNINSFGDDEVKIAAVQGLPLNKPPQVECLESVDNKQMCKNRITKSKPPTARLTNFDDVMKLRSGLNNKATLVEGICCDGGVGREAVGRLPLEKTPPDKPIRGVAHIDKETVNTRTEKVKCMSVKLVNFDDVMRLRRRHTDAAISNISSIGDDGVKKEEVEGLPVNKPPQVECLGRVENSCKQISRNRIAKSKPPTIRLTNFDDVMKLRRSPDNKATSVKGTCGDEVDSEEVRRLPLDKTAPVTHVKTVAHTDKETDKKGAEQPKSIAVKLRTFEDVMRLRRRHTDKNTVGHGSYCDDKVEREAVKTVAVNETAPIACSVSVKRSYKNVVSKRTETTKPVVAKLTNFDDVMRMRRHRTDTSTVDKNSYSRNQNTLERLPVDTTPQVAVFGSEGRSYQEIINTKRETSKPVAGSCWKRNNRILPSG